MSNGTAYRRTTSARLIARFPAVLEYLRDGRLSLASLCELRDVLNEENHRELLERASGLNEDEAKLLAATLNPKAELADSIRRVPVRAVPVLRPATAQAAEASDMSGDAQPDASEKRAEARSIPVAATTTGPLEMAWIALPPKPSELDPLSAERYSIRMTVSKDFVDEFRAVKSALSHVVPSAKMEDVFRECMRITREVCERRTLGSGSSRARRSEARGEIAAATSVLEVSVSVKPELPDATRIDGATSILEVGAAAVEPELADATHIDTATSILEVEATAAAEPEPTVAATSILEVSANEDAATFAPPAIGPLRRALESRYIPVAVRREVFERDEGCCAFVAPDGRRCRSTHQLQFHHRVPFGRGGPPDAENLTLYCALHNRYQACLDYGAAHMERFGAVPVE
jgi:hypothetical protein